MRTKILIPEAVQEAARLLKLTDPDPEIGISKQGAQDDIYVIDSPVPEHADNTPQWQDTVICVIVNDPGYFFMVDGTAYDLEVGEVIKFDGNDPHYVKNVLGKDGRAVFLIWDVDRGENIQAVANSMQKRINEGI